MKRLVIKARAKQDVRAIAEFIARDNPERAESFVDELLARMSDAAQNPRIYRERLEWGPSIRSALHHRYHIVFRETGEEVTFLRVLHGAQRFPEIFEE